MNIELNVKNERDVETLIDLVTKPVHQLSRSKVVKSHLKHMGKFSGFKYRDYVKYIVNEFIEKKRLNKEISPGYISSVIASIQRHRNDTNDDVINDHQILQIIHNLKKVFNEENKNREFFSQDGQVLFRVGPNTAIKAERNTAMYTDYEFNIIKTYFQNHLINFLSSGKQPSAEDELSLLVTILASGPHRFNEVNNLTVKKATDLVISNTTRIKDKSGGGAIDMIVSHAIAEYLQAYLEVIDKKNENLFNFGYQKMFRMYKKIYETLFSLPITGKRAFHSFRNYFSKRAHDIDPSLAQSSMNHASAKMTSHYVNRQKKTEENQKILQMFNKMYDESNL